jgi:hypothetical protein
MVRNNQFRQNRRWPKVHPLPACAPELNATERIPHTIVISYAKRILWKHCTGSSGAFSTTRFKPTDIFSLFVEIYFPVLMREPIGDSKRKTGNGKRGGCHP